MVPIGWRSVECTRRPVVVRPVPRPSLTFLFCGPSPFRVQKRTPVDLHDTVHIFSFSRQRRPDTYTCPCSSGSVGRPSAAEDRCAEDDPSRGGRHPDLGSGRSLLLRSLCAKSLRSVCAPSSCPWGPRRAVLLSRVCARVGRPPTDRLFLPEGLLSFHRSVCVDLCVRARRRVSSLFVYVNKNVRTVSVRFLTRDVGSELGCRRGS